jgi:hypothetical protein
MRSTFGTVFLIGSTLFAAWTSWISFSAPGTFGRQLGFALAGIDGRNEIRAQYGGFFLAVAIASILALAGVIPRQAAFLVNAVLFGGLITGRVMSLAVDSGGGEYGPLIRALFFIDAAGFILSLAALYLDRFRAPAS